VAQGVRQHSDRELAGSVVERALRAERDGDDDVRAGPRRPHDLGADAVNDRALFINLDPPSTFEITF